MSNKIPNYKREKAIFSAGISQKASTQSAGDLQLDSIKYTNTEDIILDNGNILFKRDMTVRVDTTFWFNSSSRVWLQVAHRSITNTAIDNVHMIGQDASGYMSLSASGKIFEVKKGETLRVVLSIDVASVVINGGSGSSNSSFVTVAEI